jgi:hypothetical protein
MLFRTVVRSILLAIAVLSFTSSSVEAAESGSDARALLKNVKAPPGFMVTLFAAPPEVSYPVCLAAGPSGEVFIGIDENGSLGTKTNRGRILRCIDSDGDGRADQFTVFARVDSPRGLFYDHGTLWVLHPPYLDAFHDDNGDGVADRSERLVEGLGFTLKTRGADHTINGIQMGIDGWLYIAAGDYGFVDAIGKDGRHVKFWAAEWCVSGRTAPSWRFSPTVCAIFMTWRSVRNWTCSRAITPTTAAVGMCD